MGARSKRIERVTSAYPEITKQLRMLTVGAHEGLTFHGPDVRQELETCWYATPFVATRDADALEASNFRVIRADLEQQCPDGVQVYHFGHWGCGWFETIYIRRDDAKAIKLTADWIKALDDYPVADESDFSELEWEMNHPGPGECYSDDPDCHPAHVNYPHEPGQLYDCPACERECLCTGQPGHTECVFCASLNG